MIEHLRDKGLGVGFACLVLGLSESAYYARKKRPKSARRLRDEQITPLIEQVYAESGGAPARSSARVCRWPAAPSSG
ncbi:hypothetical protein [Streptomyces sp. RP5T]|uniref:hypothetical protein n=1 Tax=Streptomyces sp. RP5T TaxID=2490848 RepID=UPI000F64E9F9|nr:hypothetical protein [Streptomyces sp. RP5T]RRR72725.1 hypothetical protein EHS43_38040 [Streptomyces sp. RP5T]